jgi:hypothetical protein
MRTCEGVLRRTIRGGPISDDLRINPGRVRSEYSAGNGAEFERGSRLIEIEPKASRRVRYIRLELRYLSKSLAAFTKYLKAVAEKRKR